MTKLVIVLAVVIVVILVVVIIAARSMRSEDPDEFADRPGSRGPSRGGQDDRYERHPARPGGNGRPSGRQGGQGRPAAASAGRGFDQRRDSRRGGYDEGMQGGRGYEDDRGFDRGYSERRSAQSTGPQRSRGNGRGADGRTPRRPEESQAPARAQQARSRRSSDSSEWDSSEWEKLSDVDYWAELASDKSLKTTAQPAAQARSGPDRDTEALTRRSPSAAAAPRQDPATGLPVRSRPQPAAAGLAPAAGRADFTPAPVPVSGIRDQSRAAAAASDPRPARYTDPAGLPSPGRAQPTGRPRVDPDDDPLTSPSFPRIPADDSRSYRNGRADTPPRGSRAPAPYQATTQQYASYSPSAPDYHGNGNGNGDRDTGPTYSNGYRPDPLLSRDPYGPPAETPPAPAAPATAGNPYGSYITPDSQATVSGYSEYSGAHSRPAGNGNGSYLPGETSQPASNGYWHQQPPTPGSVPAPDTPSYLSGPRQYADPLGTDGHQADYGNGYASGYAPPDPAGYPPGSYPAGPQDPAPLDPYGHDGYGGYPGYGAPGR